MLKRISIIGAGAWGTALAVSIARNNRDVVLWSHNKAIADQIKNSRSNNTYLPNIKIPNNIKITTDIDEAAGSDIVLIVTPSQVIDSVAKQLKQAGIDKEIPIVICSKGIKQDSFQLMSEVVSDILPNEIAILSGPNFADEIAVGLPAGATIACVNEKTGAYLQENIGSQMFRTYYSNDLIGAQIGGAVKNVIAIACGIAMGKNMGENAKAAIITRGLAETGRLCVALGGKYETLMGLCGIGDMILTCNSIKSRNMSLGYELGRGGSLKEILAGRKSVTEGVVTAQSVIKLAEKMQVDLPICKAVNNILHNNADVDEAIRELLQRPFGKG